MIEEITKPHPITKADPSQFSFREEALDLEFQTMESHQGMKRRIYMDKETGERFFQISPGRIMSQKLATMILKGVINVSDVVKVGENYYSHEQKFKNIESSKEDIKAEVIADTLILRLILGDNDHSAYSHTSTIPKTEHRNLFLDDINQKVNYFDFHQAIPDTLFRQRDSKPMVEMLSRLYFLEDSDDFINATSRSKRLKIIEITKKKIDQLSRNLADFSSFQKIVEHSHVELPNQNQIILFDNIHQRLEILKDSLSKLK